MNKPIAICLALIVALVGTLSLTSQASAKKPKKPKQPTPQLVAKGLYSEAEDGESTDFNITVYAKNKIKKNKKGKKAFSRYRPNNAVLNIAGEKVALGRDGESFKTFSYSFFASRIVEIEYGDDISATLTFKNKARGQRTIPLTLAYDEPVEVDPDEDGSDYDPDEIADGDEVIDCDEEPEACEGF